LLSSRLYLPEIAFRDQPLDLCMVHPVAETVSQSHIADRQLAAVLFWFDVVNGWHPFRQRPGCSVEVTLPPKLPRAVTNWHLALQFRDQPLRGCFEEDASNPQLAQLRDEFFSGISL
jgi:hypothetical protein